MNENAPQRSATYGWLSLAAFVSSIAMGVGITVSIAGRGGFVIGHALVVAQAE